MAFSASFLRNKDVTYRKDFGNYFIRIYDGMIGSIHQQPGEKHFDKNQKYNYAFYGRKHVEDDSDQFNTHLKSNVQAKQAEE